jgi:hypothetical protein
MYVCMHACMNACMYVCMYVLLTQSLKNLTQISDQTL